MLVNLIEARVSYFKMDGKYRRKVWEKYLLSDISLGAVEYRIAEIVSPLAIDGDVCVDALSRMKYEEIIGLNDSSESDLWFYVKIFYLFIEEKTGREKKEPHHYLLRAASPHEASEKMKQAMKDCQVDYKIDRIVEMGYSDVILNDPEPQFEE